jgi:hypothetical protein
VMNLAGKSVRWHPLNQCVGIKEGSIESLRR